MTSYQKSNEKLYYIATIDVIFKNLIGDALDTWRKTKLASCFEGTDNHVLRKTTGTKFLRSMYNRIGYSNYLNRTQLWRSYPPMCN